MKLWQHGVVSLVYITTQHQLLLARWMIETENSFFEVHCSQIHIHVYCFCSNTCRIWKTHREKMTWLLPEPLWKSQAKCCCHHPRWILKCLLWTIMLLVITLDNLDSQNNVSSAHHAAICWTLQNEFCHRPSFMCVGSLWAHWAQKDCVLSQKIFCLGGYSVTLSCIFCPRQATQTKRNSYFN